MSKKQRYCKTCNIEVGKGKSYCSYPCKPSTYANRPEVHHQQKNRKCKVCDIIVGKGKTYCETCRYKRKRESANAGYDPRIGQKFRQENKEICKGYYQANQKKKHIRKEKEYKKVKINCVDCNEFLGTRFDLYGVTGRPVKPKCKECKRLYRNKIARNYRKVPKNRLTSDVRTRVWQTLKGGTKHKSTFDALGYTAKQLMKHLEKQFQNGMNWDNYTKFGWHIDHIIPVDAFNFTTTKDKEFKECWKLSNLQPLWAYDNWKKNNKIL